MTSRCQIIEQNIHCDNYILMYDYIYMITHTKKGQTNLSTPVCVIRKSLFCKVAIIIIIKTVISIKYVFVGFFPL